MRLFKILRFLSISDHAHFISVDEEIYRKWKFLVRICVRFNKNYKSCEIYRKKYKMMENFVVVGLKYTGKKVKRRTSGYAKEFLTKNKNSKCLYCEVKLTDENATADHILPISEGGNNTQVNLIVCCDKCNNERGNLVFKDYLCMKNKKYKHSDKFFI